ncbi:DBP7 [Mytilus edulis]|uniref:ATP-dependent RNA helicase n=1 Tax=Mytilus edulis TaxID=6550 RepID=A0A8S3U7X4_MYTED|nr:DBP7 [Mytilus edulis]
MHTLKNKKSCGPGSISNEMIKNSQSFLIKSLNHVFNKILSTGNYPQIWAHGFITALFKNGSKDDPSNYRGLTLTSCLSKVFTKILNKRLENFVFKEISFDPSKLVSAKASVLQIICFDEDCFSVKLNKTKLTCLMYADDLIFLSGTPSYIIGAYKNVLVSNLEEKIGHKTMTAVQKQTIPYIMQGRDVLVKSQTGSGKTLAFAVPIVQALQSISPKIQRVHGPYAIVIVPTREVGIY